MGEFGKQCFWRTSFLDIEICTGIKGFYNYFLTAKAGKNKERCFVGWNEEFPGTRYHLLGASHNLIQSHHIWLCPSSPVSTVQTLKSPHASNHPSQGTFCRFREDILHHPHTELTA